MSHMRFHAPHAHLSSPYGATTFGQLAESFARFFGTPQFLIGQTMVVVAWIVVNATGAATFDPMRADRDTVPHGELRGASHRPLVPGVRAAGAVRRADVRHDRLVGARALTQVAV